MPDLRRQTTEILALHALTIEMGERAVAWGWAMVDDARFSDGIWALTALTPPFHWSEISDLVAQILREQRLGAPLSQGEATRWLARGHLEDIVAAGGEDFASLKLVSRLWFDHETPDLHVFYQFKHAIREVEATGEQGHVPGLTRENRHAMLVAACQDWLDTHPTPDPFATDNRER